MRDKFREFLVTWIAEVNSARDEHEDAESEWELLTYTLKKYDELHPVGPYG